MVASFISLAGIFFGILGANLIGLKFKNSFGFTARTIIGVFGSILFTKFCSRIGVGPKEITQNTTIDYTLLISYLIISMIGGALVLWIIIWIKNRRKNQ